MPFQPEQMEDMRQTLAQTFTLNGFLFVPLICMFFMAVRQIPPLVAIFLSICIGALMGGLFQDPGSAASTTFGPLGGPVKTYWLAAAVGFELKQR